MMGGMPMPGGMVVDPRSAAEAAQSTAFLQVQAELSRQLDALAYDVAADGDDVEEIAMWLSYNAESVLESIAGPLPEPPRAREALRGERAPAAMTDADRQDLVHQGAASYRRRKASFLIGLALLVGIALQYQFGSAPVRGGASGALLLGPVGQ